MSNPNIEKIEKPFYQKMIDLRDGLMLINDSVHRCREGRFYYLTAMSSQIRALFLEKRSDSDSLLIFVSEALKIDIKIYCTADAEELKKFSPIPDPVFLMAGPPISSEKQFSGQISLSIESFLKHKVIYFKSKFYTIDDIIRFFSNNNGGSHYSKYLPKEFVEMLHIGSGHFNALVNLFIQIGQAIVMFGSKIISSFSNQDIYIIAGITQIPKESMVIVDAIDKVDRCRFTVSIRQNGALSIVIQGMNNEKIFLDTISYLNWSRPVIFHFSCKITYDLRTITSVYVNDVEKCQVISDFPILIYSEWDSLDVLVNKRRGDEEGQPFEIYLKFVGVYGKNVSPIEKAQNLLWADGLRDQAESSGILIGSGSYMHGEIGNPNFTEIGNDIKTVMQSEVSFAVIE